jgi:hypothetical protein
MIDAIEKQAQRAVANDSHTPAWELVLMLVRKLRAANAEHTKLNQDYDVLVAELQRESERVTCECGMAPTINFPEPAFRSGED